MDLCQIGNQRVGHAIGEIFLGRISREVYERQYRNRPYAWISVQEAVAPAGIIDPNQDGGGEGHTGNDSSNGQKAKLAEAGVARQFERPSGVLISVSDQCDRTDQPIAFAHHRLQETGLLRVIAQHQANFANRRIDALLSVEENILPPKLFDDLLTADELVFPLCQQD